MLVCGAHSLYIAGRHVFQPDSRISVYSEWVASTIHFMYPLTAVAVGCTVFGERFAVTSAIGKTLFFVAVVVVVCYGSKSAPA